MDNNDVSKSLSKIPELTEQFKTLMEENDKKAALIAQLLHKQVNAVIPDDEIQRLSKSVSEAVSHTCCATPSIPEITEAIAYAIANKTADVIDKTAVESVKEVVKSVPLKVEHVHTHTTLWDLRKTADEKLKNINTALLCFFIWAVLVIGIGLAYYFNSESYIGQQYTELVGSKYLTEAEKKALWDDVYAVSALPNGYSNSPALIKDNLRRNQKIIKMRKREAQANKGKFSIDTPVVR